MFYPNAWILSIYGSKCCITFPYYCTKFCWNSYITRKIQLFELHLVYSKTRSIQGRNVGNKENWSWTFHCGNRTVHYSWKFSDQRKAWRKVHSKADTAGNFHFWMSRISISTIDSLENRSFASLWYRMSLFKQAWGT